MDTLEIIQSILNLGAERDSLRNQLFVAKEEIAAYQEGSKRLQSRCTTQADLIDELRADVDRLRAELDALRAPAPASQTKPAVMTREQILSVAREALATGQNVRAKLTDPYEDGDEDITTTIYAIDDSSIPVCLNRVKGGVRWCYLTHECEAGTEGLASLELI